MVKNEHIVYDTRAATLQKLGRVSDALKDAKMVIDLCPDSYKGYYRAATLFKLLGRVEAAKKMIDMALARLPPDSARCATVQKTLADINAAAEKMDDRKNHCWISKLPVEVLSEMMTFACMDQPCCRELIAIIGVCRHWRYVAFETSCLWQTLTLGRSRPLNKLAEWTARTSKNSATRYVKHLDITERVPSSHSIAILDRWYQTLRAIPSETLLQPTSLTWKVDIRLSSFTCFLSTNAFPSSLRELCLDLSVYSESGDTHRATDAVVVALTSTFPRLYTIDTGEPKDILEERPDALASPAPPDARNPLCCHFIHTLSLIGAASSYVPLAIPRKGLRTLSLIRCVRDARSLLDAVFVACRSNSTTLETLEVEFSGDVLLEDLVQAGEHINLPALKCLDLSNAREAMNVFTRIVAPNLEILRIKRTALVAVCNVMAELWCIGDTYRAAYQWVAWRRSSSLPWACGYTSAPPLGELRLIQCCINEEHLIPILATLSQLRILQVTKSDFDINKVVYALAGVDPFAAARGQEGSTRQLLCSSLCEVDFSGCVKLKGGALRDLVKSRLHPEAITSVNKIGDGPSPPTRMSSPLRSVTVNYCPKVEAILLPWFRSVVPLFSCVYLTRAEAAMEARRRR
ncbi:uncharacterized protein EI90DRAFT_3052625 [Cantharellus anzutake]|uniref:uncharacterized protein n=1 Tax=Cantharellus anzutake TaxID=1750568 RepID=UPI00190392BA|nr:uncharacterized protein EI90DRAFT_3052625 [Cantharellus anzutake]KAF8333637.1 hypothetical protein EI90DRAFT_3052625 [Cantharellus anzutake]